MNTTKASLYRTLRWLLTLSYAISFTAQAGSIAEPRTLQQQAPQGRAAINLQSNGQVSTKPTGIVQFRWTDRSTNESSFVVRIWSVTANTETIVTSPAASGSGSVQHLTVADLPNGSYLHNVCAVVRGADVCPDREWVPFEVGRRETR